MLPVRSLKSYNQQGFSLLEILVAVTISAALTFMAVPQISELRSTYHRLNAQSYIVQDIKKAQAESVTRGCRGIFMINVNSTGYSFGCDFLDYDTAEIPSPDGVSLVRKLPPNITLTIEEPLIFNSKGQAVDKDGILISQIIRLSETRSGSSRTFASGTLLGTGVFSFE